MPGAGYTNANKVSLVFVLWDLQSIGEYGQVNNCTSAITKAMRTHHFEKPPDLDSGRGFWSRRKVEQSLLFFIRTILLINPLSPSSSFRRLFSKCCYGPGTIFLICQVCLQSDHLHYSQLFQTTTKKSPLACPSMGVDMYNIVSSLYSISSFIYTQISLI